MVIVLSEGESEYDFDRESRIVAVNEACEDSRDCALNDLCPECEALRVAIERKLRKAFLMGQQSVGGRNE